MRANDYAEALRQARRLLAAAKDSLNDPNRGYRLAYSLIVRAREGLLLANPPWRPKGGLLSSREYVVITVSSACARLDCQVSALANAGRGNSTAPIPQEVLRHVFDICQDLAEVIGPLHPNRSHPVHLPKQLLH